MVSVVYATNRLDPGFGWFADSLAAQLDATLMEVVVVDQHRTEERAAANVPSPPSND